MEISDAKLPGNRLDAAMKQAVGHRRVQQRRDNTTVHDVIVPLQVGSSHTFRLHFALVIKFEGEFPTAGMERSANQTMVVARLAQNG